MKEIIKLIVKYHFTIIFVILEIIALSLIVMHNSYQRTIFGGYAYSFFGSISSTVTEIKDYFYLKETNEKLVAENTALRNKIEKARVLQKILLQILYGIHSTLLSVNMYILRLT